MASCSEIGIYTLYSPVDFNFVCCQSRWLSRGNWYVLRGGGGHTAEQFVLKTRISV